jgi:hypothetical protein
MRGLRRLYREAQCVEGWLVIESAPLPWNAVEDHRPCCLAGNSEKGYSMLRAAWSVLF